MRGYEEVGEIPRVQSHLHRPSLERLFKGGVMKDKGRRYRKIEEAVARHGYSQREVADYLGMHYSTLSKILAMPRFNRLLPKSIFLVH